MVSQVDILENLKDSSDEYQHVILGTYSFDPDFFEEKVLQVLRSRGAETILVLTDKREYQNRFSTMGQAGQDYHIDYCYASQIFHPKFILLVCPNVIKLFLGSANLTKEAWFESGEVIGSVTYDFSEHDSESEKILFDFRDFISKILDKNYIKSKKHRQKLSQAIEKLPINIDNKNVNVKLIHNIERPILYQIRDIIDEPVESVRIVAPFFNVEGSIFDFFSKMGCKNIQIFVQPENVHGFPKRKITKMNSNGVKITVSSIAFKDKEDRYIHAKIVTHRVSEVIYMFSKNT